MTNCLHIVSYHHVMNYMLTCSLTRDRGVYNDLIRLGAPSEVSVSHLNCVIVLALIHWRYQPATSRLSKDRVLVQLVEKQQQIFVTWVTIFGKKYDFLICRSNDTQSVKLVKSVEKWSLASRSFSIMMWRDSTVGTVSTPSTVQRSPRGWRH